MLERDGEDQLDRSYKKFRVLHGVQEKGNIVHVVKRREANWNGCIFRRNFLLQHVVEEKIEGTVARREDVNSYWMTLTF